MKCNTTALKATKFKGIKIQYLASFLFFFYCSLVVAQVKNNDALYISDNTSMYIANGDFSFGSSPATSITSRTVTPGVLSFAMPATWSNASADHYLDGYARTYSTNLFVLPVGQSAIYAPVGVDPVNTNGIEAAYYRANPSVIGSGYGSSLYAVSTAEYWNVRGISGNNAKISLTWRGTSDVSILTSNLISNLANITIVGWNGVQWVELPSSIDITSVLGGASSLVSGSITSTNDVDLSTYNYFTFGLKNSCAPLVISSGITKTWSGSWTPSSPTLSDPVVINAPYTGTLECNSLVLNADVTLADGQYLEVVGSATGTGKIVMSSKANFVQRNPSATAPTINLTKTTENKRRYDFVYLGTPISGNFLSQINLAKAHTATLAGAFDYKYKYISGPPPGNLWQTLTSITTGNGFAARVKQQAPFTNATNMDKINVFFSGTANNGTITVPVAYNPSCLNCGSSYNLLANPYPSSIDAAKFLRENAIIDGAIYLWTSNTSVVLGNYSQSDYAVWNLAGTVNTTPSSFTVDGKIDSGQGFMVKALGNGNVNFTNCMRLSGSNTANFFRMSEQLPENVNRFKLNLTNDTNVFSQILIAYIPEATLGYDRLYDAGRNSVSTAQLYSVFEEDGRKLAINSRPVFNVTDVVPIGVSKSTTDLEQFSIGIQDKEGIFTDNTISVFLHDKDLAVYHDLNNGNYNFYSNTTSLNNRFEVVYQNQSLANSEFDINSVFVNLANETLKVVSNNPIDQISVYDIAGRKIASFDKVGTKIFSSAFNHANGTYIAKIKLASGVIVTQKLINTKY